MVKDSAISMDAKVPYLTCTHVRPDGGIVPESTL